MANGILTQDLENSTTPSGDTLPDFGDNPASANFDELAGPVQQATTYTPPKEALVSSQLERILAKDSPYLDMARTRATQVANKRGLLNSSIAASGGEAAAIGAALPIAQQDAQTYGNAAQFNANTVNTFARDANAFSRNAANLKYSGVLDAAARRSNQAWQSGENAANRAFQTSERVGAQDYTTTRDAQQFQNTLAQIAAQTESAIKVYDAQNGTKLYDSYRSESQAGYDSFLQAVNAINTADMDADVKQAQIAQLQQFYTTRQQFLNTMYAETPKWQSAWSQFDINFAPGP